MDRYFEDHTHLLAGICAGKINRVRPATTTTWSINDEGIVPDTDLAPYLSCIWYDSREGPLKPPEHIIGGRSDKGASSRPRS